MENFIPVLIVAVVVNIVAFYLIIHFAVKNALKDTVRSLRILINLKARGLQKAGITSEELRDAVKDVDIYENLKRQKMGGSISDDQYLKKVREHLV